MAKTIVDVLIFKKLIDLATASKIKQAAEEEKISLEEALYKNEIHENDVAEAKAEISGYPFKKLEGRNVEAEVLRLLPEESASNYKIVPLGKEGGYLEIGTLEPEDVTSQQAVKFLSSKLNLPIKVFVITPSDFKRILQQSQSLTGEVTKALGEFKKEFESETEAPEEVFLPPRREVKIVEEAPVTKIVSVIVRHAVEGRASDIHIEPMYDRLRVRFRVDGVLHTSLVLPLETHPAVATRIKVMTNMKIDESRIPQDGRFHLEITGKGIDFRVSTFPTSFGEKIVIRILDPGSGLDNLPAIGVEGRSLEQIEASIKRPFGLILITGPTGSGKSTTLFSLLKLLNDEGSNIVSLEDPIEYYVPGVSQSQVRPEIGYDFATGLRHILRQDPDKIMVGEIRDKETAAMAIHAALTGHLVLSTLHTNNATGVIPRLIDMGVDPYLIPPTLILAVAQRLARRLCTDSKKKVKLSGGVKEVILQDIESMPETLRQRVKKEMPSEIYQAVVSPTCPKGARGRIGVFEVLTMTPELEKIILTGPSETRITEEAKRQGMITMRQDGVLKVFKGLIGLEELLEIT